VGAEYGWPAYVLSETVDAFGELQTTLEQAEGISLGIADYGGFRSLADLEEILADRSAEFEAAVNAGEIPAGTDINAWRPIAPYGHSFHNFGAAFDVRVKPGGAPAGMSDEQAFAVAGQYAPQFGLRWGGAFPDPDDDHFELAVSLSQARSMFASEYGSMATVVAANVQQFDSSGLGADDVGDDAGSSLIAADLASQENLVVWVVTGAALFSALALYLSRR
jgi:D-alanyl-D-alanine carboxypeptidase